MQFQEERDSLALWDILDKLGYRADELYIGLGIDEGIRYSYESICMTRHFAHDRNLHFIEVDIPSKYGESIPQIAQRTQRGRKKNLLYLWIKQTSHYEQGSPRRWLRCLSNRSQFG